jgi:hypothetical protein
MTTNVSILPFTSESLKEAKKVHRELVGTTCLFVRTGKSLYALHEEGKLRSKPFPKGIRLFIFENEQNPEQIEESCFVSVRNIRPYLSDLYEQAAAAYIRELPDEDQLLLMWS